ncbi:alpha-hydroxy acid oxidase [Actinocorallia libanotica]|uniref:Alpha-hydroxy acid oxidase n=1 Tax=Actinocorallia libanotica TaxID=46162 RepID=A0ABP4C9B0_9ACTN
MAMSRRETSSAARLVSIEDARRRARRRVPLPVFDVADGAAEAEVTARRNLAAFADVRWYHRAATAAGAPDTGTTLLGRRVAFPLVTAPCGLAGAFHPAAEPAVARAAARAGVPAAISTCSSASLEEVGARGGDGGKWFQLYFLGGRDGAESLIDRAAGAGYEALVVTVDTPVSGHRERDGAHGVSLPMDLSPANLARLAPVVARRPGWLWRLARDRHSIEMGNAGAAGDIASIFAEPPTWADLGWIRERWNGPLVVKGLMTPADARRAVDAGADAVVVSNHGGRQLDGLPASLEALPAVVEAVGDRAEVLLDGGVRRGSDIAKALALGARAVLAGRAHLYGLAAAGEPGVDRVLELLAGELRRTMTLLGCASVADLGPHLLDPSGEGR